MTRIISTIPFFFGLVTFYIVAIYPNTYDLLQEGELSSIKEQQWGTCWAFSTISSLESNILKKKLNFTHDLSEYHLDKFNGFNRNGTDKDPRREWFSSQGKGFIGSNTDNSNSGLMVHLGGDYKVAAAYLSNTLGAVEESKTPTIKSENDFDSFGNTPNAGVLLKNNYRYVFPKSIEWLSWGESWPMTKERIKKELRETGAVGSAQFMQPDPLDIINERELHLNTTEKEPNHAISIIGWDDNLSYQNSRGAWLIKDSDHIDDETGDKVGPFYIPYKDLIVGRHMEMGAVSFKDVTIRDPRTQIYSHALHGWRYTKQIHTPIKNLYVIKSSEYLDAIGIYIPSPMDSVNYSIIINGKNIFKNTITKENPGFYYIELSSYNLLEGDRVEVIQENKSGLYAIDSSSWMSVLLGEDEDKLTPQWIESSASPGESFYFENGKWQDLITRSEKDSIDYSKANFPIILYTIEEMN
ncbi:C1 family peptidase [Halobacteriovorax sp.]|uniref:C1 family peptidase n=1 Tax=Halobacteriovorax sp. TaxID=2020862 RepID=UPI00356AB2CD